MNTRHERVAAETQFVVVTKHDGKHSESYGSREEITEVESPIRTGLWMSREPIKRTGVSRRATQSAYEKINVVHLNFGWVGP